MEWTTSAARHAIPRDDAIYVISHPEGSAELDSDQPDEQVVVYVGRAHPQTDRRIEVIAAIRPAHRTMVIFHVMELSDLYRHLVPDPEEEA